MLTGGGPPADPELARVFFISPTVFDRVTPQMRIGSEEIFGPVMAVMSWSAFDEMIDIANGVMYGLTASIVTNDFSTAMRAAERLEAGYVWINPSGRYLGAVVRRLEAERYRQGGFIRGAAELHAREKRQHALVAPWRCVSL